MMINVATAEQRAAVAKVGKQIWEQHYTPIIGEAQVAYMLEKFQSAEAIAQQQQEGYTYFMLELEGQLLGYLAVQVREEALFLSKFYLVDHARGKGYGRKMMTFVEDFALAKGCEIIRLTVNKYNSKTMAVYEKLGFERKEAVIADIGSGYIMDDFVYEKKLK